MKRPLALALVLAAGCTGSVSGGGEPGNPTAPPMAGTMNPATPPGPTPPGPAPSAGPCAPATLPRARTWRLSHTQFRNTVRAVFGFVGPGTDGLPLDGQPDGFANQADRLTVPSLLASRYLAATDEIAANVVTRSAEFVKCPLAALGTGTCLRDFLTTVGSRAWRRPLTAAEVDKYNGLYAKVAAGSGPEAGFKSVVQALLLSPNFLFRTELGTEGSSGPLRLTDHEIASALSYMLVDGPPDAALMQLADGGKLRDPATLAQEAGRLLGSGAAARESVGSFFRQWLQFDSLPALSKDTAHFPDYTPELVDDLLVEAQTMVEGLFDPAGSVKTLLTTTDSTLSPRTAALYGVTITGTGFAKAKLPAGERRGLLTSAAFIAASSDSDDTNLPARGRIVREQALCATVAPPTGDFQLEDPKITPDMTNREKFGVHTSNPACASCHALFDGIGFAMEQYDAIGRFRTKDKTKTIDATGTLPLEGRTLSFKSYVDFIDQVSGLPETYQCVAAQYAAYATGRAPGEISTCERDAIVDAFAKGNHKLEALVAAIVTSPSFTVRRN